MKKYALYLEIVAVSAVIVLLVFLSHIHYLLFHTATEMFTICVAVNIAIVVLTSRKYTQQNYFLFLGISCTFAAIFDFVHTLSYQGMNIFPEYGPNLAPQMWIIARFLESTAMLSAFYFMKRPFHPVAMMSVYGVISVLLLLSVFQWKTFPAAFVAGQGLTPFKIWSEYLICGVLILSALLLKKHSELFHPRVLRLLMLAYGLTICTEISFTLYVDMYGLSNLMGHIFKVLAYYCLYCAVIKTSLQEPYKSLFFELNKANDMLSKSTEELDISNQQLRKEIEERLRAERELQHHTDNLETIIADRTWKLSLANQELSDTLKEMRVIQSYLVRAEKMADLGTLVAGVAHEINTPVGIGVTATSNLYESITRFQELSDQGLLKRQDLVDFIEDIKEAAAITLSNLEKAARLIKSFKQLSVDQAQEVCRNIYVKAYLNEILLSLQPKLRATKHRVSVECADDLVLACFPGAFSQIITNLIMNSLIHAYDAEDQGNIKIMASQENGTFVLQYSDDGKGMTAETQAQIFKPFFTTKQDQGGTGLGLYVLENIITKQFNGSFSCQSSLGQGTVFMIRIPLS